MQKTKKLCCFHTWNSCLVSTRAYEKTKKLKIGPKSSQNRPQIVPKSISKLLNQASAASGGRARLGRSQTRFRARSRSFAPTYKFSEAPEALRARLFARTGSSEALEALGAPRFGGPRGTSSAPSRPNKVFGGPGGTSSGPGGTSSAPFRSNRVIAYPQAHKM